MAQAATGLLLVSAQFNLEFPRPCSISLLLWTFPTVVDIPPHCCGHFPPPLWTFLPTVADIPHCCQHFPHCCGHSPLLWTFPPPHCCRHFLHCCRHFLHCCGHFHCCGHIHFSHYSCKTLKSFHIQSCCMISMYHITEYNPSIRNIF